jgi:hypothetical protein
MWLMTGALYPVDEIFRALSHPKHDMAQLVHGRAGLRAIPVAVTDSHPAHIRTDAPHTTHRGLQKSFAKRLVGQVGGAAADEQKENPSWRRI